MELENKERQESKGISAKKLIKISFFLSLLLVFAKFYAYYITSSNAILTDALESIINVIATGFAFYSIYLSALPKDVNHPYGHGKIEFFSAGFEGALIFLAGIFIIYQSILNLIEPADIDNLPMGILIVGISAIVNGALGYVLQKNGKRLDSYTLLADGKHLLTDSISSFLLLLGIAIIFFTQFYILDSIISILFALYILYNGYFLIRLSVAGLMDESNPEAMAKVVSILKANKSDNWIDIHNMKIQKYGPDIHIDCHITLPYYFNLQKVHFEIKELEEVLSKEFVSNLEIFTHADPCIPGPCCTYCRLKDCAVRTMPYSLEVEWNAENLSKNQKHFHEDLDKWKEQGLK